METQEEWLSVAEAAAIVGMTRNGINKAIISHKHDVLPAERRNIPHYKRPVWLIRYSDLMAWNTSRKRGPRRKSTASVTATGTA